MRPELLEKVAMSALSVAERLIGEEMLFRRVKKPEAREIVAREAGVAAGSLESLARGRLKNIERLASKLNALRIRKLEEKLVSVQHELAIAKAMGVASQVDIDRAEAAIKEAFQALRK
jgi:hypothetical protein